MVSLYESSNNTILNYTDLDASGGYTAALKVTSKAKGIVVHAHRLIGGGENCVDVNNGVDGLTVTAIYAPLGKYALSAKASRAIRFVGHIRGRAKRWEVNLGSWSDQSRAVQTGTLLELTADTYPIRVWVGNADIPLMDDPKKYQLMGFGRYGPAARKLVMFLWDLGKRLNLPGV